jgi:hypothetical protein
MVACAVVFSVLVPGEADRIFFGDVSEPLPNGYTLKVLAKMSDYGMIEDSSASFRGAVSLNSPWLDTCSLSG